MLTEKLRKDWMIPSGNLAGALGTLMPGNFPLSVLTILCMGRLCYPLNSLGSKQIIPTTIPSQPIYLWGSLRKNKLREIGLKIVLKQKSWQVDDPTLVLVNNPPIGGANGIAFLLFKHLIW